MNAPDPKQLFTVEEANQRLPLVKRIIEDIVKKFSEISERQERLYDIKQRSGNLGSAPNNMYLEELDEIEQDIRKEIDLYDEYRDELSKLGVELKDPEKGLIDFRSMMDGREVYLCWHLGEEEIGFWHELDAGFSGRQSLLETSAPQSPEE